MKKGQRDSQPGKKLTILRWYTNQLNMQVFID